ncbi:hypothetical protein CIB95_09820 [Lottiidibacillus patelloidae]|uniref:Uncharacterized protein n=2 Tax=Lottiidibacillus patelloidae TaxID=2670334 RepID=A0A263BTJ7_9BACI|nr:hypothetical protein CIB95_09820 [Lottiidibacillus patelloidae]
MKDSHCSKCGKKRKRFIRKKHRHFSYHDDCSCFHDHHHLNCDCHHHCDSCDRFICDDDFRFNLGGLQGGLNFRLRQLIGCNVKMELDEDKEINAHICFVGSDFVEVDVLEELEKNDSVLDELIEVDIEEVVEENAVEKNEEINKKKRKMKKTKSHHGLIVPFRTIKFIELNDEFESES